MEDKVYYEDMGIEIGDTIYCVGTDGDIDFWNSLLTVGKRYLIEDLEYKFPDSICVKSDNDNLMFFPAKLFSNDIKLIRKIKLQNIEK